jgi:hypothetical protein
MSFRATADPTNPVAPVIRVFALLFMVFRANVAANQAFSRANSHASSMGRSN